MGRHYLNTGQRQCYDTTGRPIGCAGSGQDADLAPGHAWPVPRFEARGVEVVDHLTGLIWLRDADPFEWPMSWPEALERVAELEVPRRLEDERWRLPNRRELRSLIAFATRDPALPEGHPFDGVWLGWYWTSSTAAINTAYAWYVHMEGGRMFYGRKDEDHLVWPVRGRSEVLPVTGQIRCFDGAGQQSACGATGQDGALQAGVPWPEPRLEARGGVVRDRLTGLTWLRRADVTSGLTTWEEGLAATAALARERRHGIGSWRLPTINELESLVDASTHSPALPAEHPFEAVRDEYWSSTSSGYEPDWAMALYLRKGAIGVGQKKGRYFSVWAVAES
jgi:hypothetical protein